MNPPSNIKYRCDVCSVHIVRMKEYNKSNRQHVCHSSTLEGEQGERRTKQPLAQVTLPEKSYAIAHLTRLPPATIRGVGAEHQQQGQRRSGEGEGVHGKREGP
eukprot:5418476-Pyramimonas_sp.AAC.1